MPIKIVCISDTHNMHDKLSLSSGDILLHAGDATFQGYQHELESFGEWFRKQPFTYKVFVAGNHDTSFENTPTQAKEWFYDGKTNADIKQGDDGVYYLQDELLELELYGQKVNIWGAPWQPEFCNWAFNLPRGKPLKAKWDLIPKGTDIIVTHGPPYKLCDQVNRNGEHVGCRDLRAALQRVKPKLHVCGHIHEGYGTEVWDNTIVANASICTAGYKPTNKPIIIEIDDEGKMQVTSQV